MTLARELADTAGRPQVDKNLLINGGMNVWQRNTSVTGITSGGYKTVDRWDLNIVNSFGTGAGTYTMAQSTDVPANQGFAYSTRIDCTTVGDQVGTGTNYNWVRLNQYIEGQNLQHLLKGTSDAKALTLSFWVKSTRASNFVVQFTDPTNTRQISKLYTINTANTWEKKTILIPGDTTGTIDNDNTSGFQVSFWLFAGLNFLTGTLATSWGSHVEADWAAGAQSLVSTSDDWSITGVQLEVGEAATDFQFEPYDTVLRKCQRYLYHYDSTANVFARVGVGAIYVANAIQITFNLPATMRSAPTLESSSAASTFRVVSNSAGYNCSSITVTESNNTIVGFQFGFTGGNSGDAGWVSANNTNSAYFNLSSEL